MRTSERGPSPEAPSSAEEREEPPVEPEQEAVILMSGDDDNVIGMLRSASPVSPAQQQAESLPSRSASTPTTIPSTRPTMGELPPLSTPMTTSSPELRELWERTRRFLAHQGLPPQAQGQTLDQWVHGTVQPWIVERSRELREATDLYTSIERPGMPDRVVGPALLGQIYRDMAVTLSQLPIPSRFANNPEVVAEYRETVTEYAAPLLEQSFAAFQACSQEAQQRGAAWSSWAAFCNSRSAVQ